MKNMCILFFISALVLLSAAEPDQKKFPLCKVCRCNFKANETTVDVLCTAKPVPFDIIYQDFFWTLNATNESVAYNSLAIHDNKLINLTQVFPPSNLTVLDLANNNIMSIQDSIFRNLQNMKVLILSYNDMDLIHPDAFKGLYLEERLMPLRSLKELRLDHNQLHTLNQNIFEHATDLEILDLSHNDFQTIDHPTLLAISSLPLLKKLYLQYTGLKSLPDNMLHTPRRLEILDLSGNTEFNKIPSTLVQAINLQELYLNNTGFVNLTQDNGFPNMPSIRILHLCRNEHLHHVGKHSLSGLTNLTDLRMCDNIDLVTIDELALAKPSKLTGGAIWPPIKKLYIGNNKLSYLESEIVARWDSLSELDIRENPWTCECENQWLIDDLMPIYLKINEDMAKEVMCAAPVEMRYFSFYDILMKKSQMRCLDMYGNRPEKDGVMLVGVLSGKKVYDEDEYSDYIENQNDSTGNTGGILQICQVRGVLIAIPLILFMLYAYQRRWFSIAGFFDKSPASYSRRFYSSTPHEEF